MSEALDAMVKAMIDEFERQADEEGSSSVAEGQPGGVVAVFSRLDGYFDLEKVARAGLAGLATSAEERDRIARVIFVKVDNTLYAPEHPSIQAAVEAILSGQGRPEAKPAADPDQP